MNRMFLVNAPSVVSEVIDGEVIVMNLKSGNYYSSDKVGAVVWSWIEAGKTEEEINGLAARRYDAVSRDIRSELRAFFDKLIEEALVREVAAPGSAAAIYDDRGSPAQRETFVTPELCAYTDMRDLLLLDPIHDVDPVGWPTPKESEAD